jgi:hypothetical protein
MVKLGISCWVGEEDELVGFSNVEWAKMHMIVSRELVMFVYLVEAQLHKGSNYPPKLNVLLWKMPSRKLYGWKDY